jgi:hypothetical protein
MYALLFCTLFVFPQVSAAGGIDLDRHLYGQTHGLVWLDRDLFAVGRWDGTLSVFNDSSNTNGSEMRVFQTMTIPSLKGIEMLALLPTGDLASSKLDFKAAVW